MGTNENAAKKTGTVTNPSIDAKPVSDVKVGGNKSSRRSVPGKKAVIAALVIALLLVGGYLVIGQLKTDSSDKKSTAKIPVVPYDQQLANELSAAKAKVAKNASSSVSKKQKFDAYLALAAAYMNEDKPADAVKAYQDALATDPSAKLKVLDGLMYAYSANDQQTEAIATGEELLALLNAQKSSSDSLANDSYISSVTNDLNTLKSGAKLE